MAGPSWRRDNGDETEDDDKIFSSAMATTCPPPQATLRIRTGHIPIVRVRAIELRMVQSAGSG